MRFLAYFMLCSVACAQAPGRMGFGHDGNYHDTDDVGAITAVLAVINDMGATNDVVHIEFNNHGPQNNANYANMMVASAYNGPYRHPRMFDCRVNRAAAVSNLRAEIMKSTITNPFWYALGGPPDIVYDALQGVPASAKKYFTIVSHSSSYNETTGGVHTLAQCTGVNKIFIPNGNTKLNTKQNWSPWSWFKTNEPFMYGRMKTSGRADVSDVTMCCFMMTGVRQASIADLRWMCSQ